MTDEASKNTLRANIAWAKVQRWVLPVLFCEDKVSVVGAVGQVEALEVILEKHPDSLGEQL